LCIAHLDSFMAVYHRNSGITHLITAPAPEILATLGEAGMTFTDLRETLVSAYELGDRDDAALAARLDELVAAGLVSTG
ncbi:MAG: HPr-rel-A system PqqD family peptide chaperone, partial [Sphingomonas sp.]